MYIAAYIVTGFLVAGVYAFGRLRGRWGRYERTALAIPLTVAALAAPAQVLVGDWNGREVAQTQPTKLAALEGLGETKRGASLHVLGWYTDNQVKYGIGIPKLLSTLAFHDPNATVQGLDAVPADDRPPVNVVRVAFQTMVAIGTMLALIGVAYLVVRVRRKRLPESPWFYRALVLAGPLSVVALISGWVTTEVGRQPWVVYRVMRTSDAVTGAGGIPVGYAALALVYLAVGVAVAWVLRRLARIPMDPPAPAADGFRGRLSNASLRAPARLLPDRAGALCRPRRRGLRRRVLAALCGQGRAGVRVRDHAHNMMAPVWEANHVWLIFVLTVVWTAYPTAFGSIASTLSIPLFIAAVGIIFRGGAYALRAGSPTPGELRADRRRHGARLDHHAVRPRGSRRRNRLRASAGRERGGRSRSRAGSTPHPS